jgi:hypothetical protein
MTASAASADYVEASASTASKDEGIVGVKLKEAQ